jgi:DNA-binding MarR family transcriptional regulator
MTKQAMGELVDQCVLLGLVERVPDPADGRARTVRFTKDGLVWLDEFSKAVDRAEAEMSGEIGQAKLESIRAGLAKYGAKYNSLQSLD